MPCFASSLLDSNRRQRALQILNGPTGQEIKILVETAWAKRSDPQSEAEVLRLLAFGRFGPEIIFRAMRRRDEKTFFDFSNIYTLVS